MPVPALLSQQRVPLFVSLLWLLVGVSSSLSAQYPELGRCSRRPTVIDSELSVDNVRWCTESIVHEREIEPFAFTALEVAPDGVLYATRPLSGQVMVIRDSDGDALPDAMETLVAGLTLPNGLAYHDGDLYVSGGANIYRISEPGGRAEVTTVVDDLPSGSGFWTGGLAIGADERLYVAVGAPCSDCEFDQAERGVILSMELDGSDRQALATGFRQPADVEFYRGALWTLDSAALGNERSALDELNRVEAGGWYGFPYCLGAGVGKIASAEIDCADSISPVMLFGTGAVPSSLAAYPHDTWQGTADSLIVVLSGEPSQIDIVGYKVIMINFDQNDQPLGATILIPYRLDSQRQAYLPYRAEGLFFERFIHINELGWGFFPQQPLAVAVSPEGWIYISMTGGRIIALRPRAQAYSDDLYPVWTPMNPNFDPAASPP